MKFTKRSQKRAPRKPWFVLQIKYRTQGGAAKITRSKPFARREDCWELQKQYEATGHDTIILEVRPPAAKLTRRAAVDRDVLPLPGMEDPKHADAMAALRKRGGR